MFGLHKSRCFKKPKRFVFNVKRRNVATINDIRAGEDFTDRNRMFSHISKNSLEFLPLTTSEIQAIEEEELHISSFYNQITPILFAIQIFGILPIKRGTSGVSFTFCSIPMLYCIFVYVAIFPTFLFIIKERINEINNTARFDAQLGSEIFISMLFPYLCVPFVVWWDTPSIVTYINSWKEFQAHVLEVAGRPLALRLRGLSYLWLTLGVVCITISTACTVNFPPSLKVWQAAICCQNIILLVLWSAYWRLNCAALCAAGDAIFEAFKISLNKYQTEEKYWNVTGLFLGVRAANEVAHNYVIPQTVVNYKHLWLQLSSLAGEMGSSSYHVFGAYLLLNLWFVTASLYGGIAAMRNREYLIAFVFGLSSVNCGIPMFLICDGGYRVSRKIKNKIQNELRRVARYGLVNASALTEINSFSQTVSLNPPQVNLAGFVTVDRELFLSAGATLVTYIIVLLQFRMSFE